ncbi:alpha-tocopherol transfer protein-like [Cydia pomonella]|uniref:alpha-tocopherol transfer protein-like n=1 Tax=Cydia pomonella TaxID=82600 RepID=UPI002ADDE58D|nr:alpha-tocopherol transfer protein-like [Cydia pomonella]
MYNIKENKDLAINSRLLLNSDRGTLNQLFNELGVDPGSVDAMLRTIHEWYQKQPHLPAGQLHDQFIARLLIMRKFSIEQVKQKIDNYYAVRPKMPELLGNRDLLDPTLTKYIKDGFWLTLPRKTQENHRVTILRVQYSEGVSVQDFVKVLTMIVDYRMWNDSVLGEQVIFDYSNVTIPLAMQFTPVFIKRAIYYFTECLGPNIKGIHIVNLPPFAEYILSAVKKLLKPKVVQRIHVYKNLQEVLEKIPITIIPKDLGGTDDVTCQDIADAWENTLGSVSWRNFFIQQDSIHTDETKRTVKKNFQDEFGLDGSFKKLNID